MIKEFFKKSKSYLISTFSIIFIVAIFVFIVLLVIYLRKSNKKIQIVPTFKIVDSQVDENLAPLTESINIAKEILNKVKK